MFGQHTAGNFVGLLGNTGQTQDAIDRLGSDKMVHDLSGMLGQAADVVNRNGGPGLLDRVNGMAGHAHNIGSNGAQWMEQHVPGAAFLMDEAQSLWNSDVPGGFQLGDSVDIAASTIPGVKGFVMQSIPDGAEYFIAEDFGWFDCCCFWTGKGPTYHVIEGNPMNGEEVLTMQSHKMCCCVSPELDVVTVDGDVIARADEHAACCCFAHTRVDVRSSEVYRLTGNLFGALCSCFTSEHDVEDNRGKSVGKVVHWSSGAHIQFPVNVMASHKAALLAATLLTDLRRR
mmetsp:Transcript_21628/g.54108  ORF Transcript_21628/g.54108 Transcript_21628/m.54108 type:complete len:286 (-) Transcript_21628:62-919(-)